MEQGIAILVSAIIGTLVIAVFVAVGRSAHTVGSTNDIAAAAARWRRIVFWGLSVLFVPTIASLADQDSVRARPEISRRRRPRRRGTSGRGSSHRPRSAARDQLPSLGPMGRAFVIANVLPMWAVVGWAYIAAPECPTTTWWISR